VTDEEPAKELKQRLAALEQALTEPSTTDFPRDLIKLGKIESVENFYVKLINDSKKRSHTYPTDLQGALAELEEAFAESAATRKRWLRGKTISGRPSSWKSPLGLGFVILVRGISASEHCNISVAIDRAINRYPELRQLKNRGRRSLQVRYQEAAKYWDFAFNDSYLQDYNAATARLKTALDQFAAAVGRLGARPPRPRSCASSVNRRPTCGPYSTASS
jgi:hypothetical protein